MVSEESKALSTGILSLRTGKATATFCTLTGHEGSLETLNTLGNILTTLLPVHKLALAEVNNLRARNSCGRGSLGLHVVRNMGGRNRGRKAIDGGLQSLERANRSILVVRDNTESVCTPLAVGSGLVEPLDLMHQGVVQLGELSVFGRKLLEFLEGLVLLPVET